MRTVGALIRYVSAMNDTKRERSPWSDAVAAQIRAERAAGGYSQAEMIARSGIPRSTYIRLEHGDKPSPAGRIADATQIARLCQAWGILPSEFFRRVEERLAANPPDPPD